MPRELAPVHNDLSHRRALWELLKLSVPSGATAITRISAVWVATAIVARYEGFEGLAAAGIFTQAISVTLAVGRGPFAPICVAMGRAYKTNESMKVGIYYQRGWAYAIIMGAPFVPIFLFSSPLLQALGRPTDLSNSCQSFLRPYVPCLVSNLLLSNAEFLALSVGKSHVTFLSGLLERALFAMSAYVMIAGKFGLPKLGVAGLGWAYALSTWAAVLWLNVYFRLHPAFKPLGLFNLRSMTGVMRQILRDGSKVSMQQVSETSTLLVLALIVQNTSKNALPAYQAAMPYILLIVTMMAAIAQATANLVAQHEARENRKDTFRIGNMSVALSLLPPVTLSVASWLIPRPMLSFFFNPGAPENAALTRLAGHLLLLMAVSETVDAFRFACSGGLRGFSNNMFSMLMSVLIFGISASLGYAALALGFSAEVPVAARYLALLLGTIPLLVYWVVQTQKPLPANTEIAPVVAEANQRNSTCFGCLAKVQQSARDCWNGSLAFFGRDGDAVVRRSEDVVGLSEVAVTASAMSR